MEGLRTKTVDFSLAVLTKDYDIIVITETWPAKGISSTELFDHRYQVFRRDRDNDMSRGGVVLVAAKKELVLIIGDFNIPFYETRTCDKTNLLNELLHLNDLTQQNTITDHMQRKLDLILSNTDICTLKH
nr:unnamed protein product [Callosobruchus chinensis]